MGTELQRRETDTELPLWSARALIADPELVWTIHGDEVAAGADILTANTFRTHARSLARGGAGERAGELSALAVRLAHQAAAATRPRGVRRRIALAARGLLPAGPRPGRRGARTRARRAGAVPRRGRRGSPPRRDAQHGSRGRRRGARGPGDRPSFRRFGRHGRRGTPPFGRAALGRGGGAAPARTRRARRQLRPGGKARGRPGRARRRGARPATRGVREPGPARRRPRAGRLPRSSSPRTTRARRRAGSASAPGSSAAAAERRRRTRGRCARRSPRTRRPNARLAGPAGPRSRSRRRRCPCRPG